MGGKRPSHHHSYTMSYYRRPSSSTTTLQDMSSYVAVEGTPILDNCNVFGLTPHEVRYLQVRGCNTPADLKAGIPNCETPPYLQSKFQLHLSSSPPQQNPHHGIRVEATAIVVLNALGYIGFKVISTSGDKKVGQFVYLLTKMSTVSLSKPILPSSQSLHP